MKNYKKLLKIANIINTLEKNREILERIGCGRFIKEAEDICCKIDDKAMNLDRAYKKALHIEEMATIRYLLNKQI